MIDPVSGNNMAVEMNSLEEDRMIERIERALAGEQKRLCLLRGEYHTQYYIMGPCNTVVGVPGDLATLAAELRLCTSGKRADA